MRFLLNGVHGKQESPFLSNNEVIDAKVRKGSSKIKGTIKVAAHNSSSFLDDSNSLNIPNN
jgi:hypothetical protein